MALLHVSCEKHNPEGDRSLTGHASDTHLSIWSDARGDGIGNDPSGIITSTPMPTGGVAPVQSSLPTPVTAFIDWNAQIHNVRLSGKDAPTVAERTLDYVGRMIGRALSGIDSSKRFDVSIRIYHGWRRGFEPTANRRALVTAAAGTDFISLSRKASVAIRPDLGYGDRMLSALDIRLHSNI